MYLHHLVLPLFLRSYNFSKEKITSVSCCIQGPSAEALPVFNIRKKRHLKHFYSRYRVGTREMPALLFGEGANTLKMMPSFNYLLLGSYNLTTNVLIT